VKTNWKAIHQKLFGRGIGQPETEENKLLARIMKDFEAVVLKQGKAFVRQVAIESDKAGVPMEWLPYIFFLLKEQRKNWPDMPKKQERALAVGRDIMDAAGDTPPYHAALRLPPSEIEEAVDTAFQNLALWCQTILASTIGQGLVKIFKKYAKAIEKLRPDVPKRRGPIYLRAAVMLALETRPTQFPHGLLLWDVLYVLL